MSHDYPEARPIGSPATVGVLSLESDAARDEYMRQLGAVNIRPPLPRSTHLRNKRNGHVLPWEEILAEQPDIFDCCDASGNTDPSAWETDVDYSDYDPEDRQVAILQAQERALLQAREHATTMMGDFKVESIRNPNVVKTSEYPNGAVPYENVDKLTDKLLGMLD